ncbi:MAG: hypothetical protein VZR24_17770 [Butyrivibrio hungatei]|nr:hypothetical protein [Butyrivibrio hungatei]
MDQTKSRGFSQRPSQREGNHAGAVGCGTGCIRQNNIPMGNW